MKVYDLFCGLGGWAEGFLAEGYAVTGFDIEAHTTTEREDIRGGSSCGTFEAFTARSWRMRR